MFFDISREYANLDQNDHSHLESFDLQEIFLSITNSILTGKQCTRCSSFNMEGFFRDNHVFHYSHEFANLDQNDLSHLVSFDLQEIFLSITNSIYTGKQCAICSCL
jgi:hypothetical protein